MIQPCAATHCPEYVRCDRAFCPYHWRRLPAGSRRRLANAYRPEQWWRGATRRWDAALWAAVAELEIAAGQIPDANVTG